MADEAGFCGLSNKDILVKSDRNLVEGSGSFIVKNELEDLEFVVSQPYSKYVCRRCVETLKKRNRLKKGLMELNSMLLNNYKTVAMKSGRTVKQRFTEDYPPCQAQKTSLLKPCEEVSQSNEPSILCVQLEKRGEVGPDLGQVMKLPALSSTPKKSTAMPLEAGGRMQVQLRINNEEDLSIRPSGAAEPMKSEKQTSQKDVCDDKSETTVVVTVNWPSQVRKRVLSKELNTLGIMLLRGTHLQIAKAIWKTPALQNALMEVLKNEIYSECNAMCSIKEPSCLRKTGKEDMLQFSFLAIDKELEKKARLLRTIIKAASIPKSRESNPNYMKWLPATSMAVSIPLKNNLVL